MFTLLFNLYQLIMVVVLLISIITFINQDTILLYILVSTSIVYGPRCFIVVSSYFIFYPDTPETHNHTICISVMFLFLVTFKTSWFYSSTGYVAIAPQDLYSTFCKTYSILYWTYLPH